MRFISTKIHGYLDYIVGILLIAAPWIFNLDADAPEGIIFIILGVMALVYSLLTRYELGAIKVISMSVHLTLDLLSGIILAVSPWLFNFNERVYLPHLILGLVEIAAALTTKRVTKTEHEHVGQY